MGRKTLIQSISPHYESKTVGLLTIYLNRLLQSDQMPYAHQKRRRNED